MYGNAMESELENSPQCHLSPSLVCEFHDMYKIYMELGLYMRGHQNMGCLSTTPYAMKLGESEEVRDHAARAELDTGGVVRWGRHTICCGKVPPAEAVNRHRQAAAMGVCRVVVERDGSIPCVSTQFTNTLRFLS
jgi:hypothetical protein